MDSENQEKLRFEYQAGKNALERGQYRLSVQHLETARELVTPSTRIGGDVQIWLITAYQAAGMGQEAIALCKKLSNHPHSEIRKQAKRLQYIMEAPRLKRPKEWMTEIPDLAKLSESDEQYRRGSSKTNGNTKDDRIKKTEAIDLSKVDTKDNQFIWVALLVIILGLAGFIFSSYII